MGINKPEFRVEWIRLTPLLLIYIVGAALVLSFPLCIFGCFVYFIGDWLNVVWLSSAGEALATTFGYIAAIISGTIGIL
jgi:hypothetical protein